MKEVILINSGESAWDCPFDAELWATTSVFPVLDELDSANTKLFSFGSDSYDARKIATDLHIPIVSNENYATEQYPYSLIVQEFGISYFWSPLSYMLAYAVYLKYEKIKIYGFDIETDDEYKHGKPRIAFWLGVAKGRGIECEIAPKSKLYRVMKDNVRDRYERAMALRDAVTREDYVKAIEKHGDPYCFVSGLDKDACTVRNYDDKGKEVSSWHPNL